MEDGEHSCCKTTFDRYLSKELTWGEAWNLVIGEVIKKTNGGFSLSSRDGELVPIFGNVVIGPGLEKELAGLVSQAKKLLNEPGRRPEEV